VSEDRGQPADVEAGAPTTSRADTWASLMADPRAFDSERQLFEDALQGIRAFVGNEPRATEVVGRVLERRSRRVPLDRALGEVTEGLVSLLGTDAAYLLHWLNYASASERLDHLATFASPDVTTFLREVVAEHGAVLDRIQGAGFAHAKDWSYIEKSGTVDTLSGRQSFSLALTRWDGKVLRLQLSPDSLMNLTSHLVELINSAHSLSAFSAQALEAFTDRLVITVELLRELDESSEDEAAGETATAETADR
jgi:hypothetical protein